jgi:hypothetical protein
MDTAGGRPVPLPDDGLPVIERSAVGWSSSTPGACARWPAGATTGRGGG